METKLTLRLNEKLIHRAKKHARKSGKSVSRLVADFFGLLDSGSEKKPIEMTPTVKSLRGVFRGINLKIDDYRRHLEERHL